MLNVTGILNDMEDTLEDFRASNAILDLDKEGAKYFDQYFAYDNKKKDLQIQLQSINNLEKYIIGSKDSLFLPPAVYLSFGDKFLESNAARLFLLQTEYNQLLNGVKPGHQGLALITQAIDSIRSNMLNYLRNDRTAIKQSIKSLSQERDTTKIRLKQYPQSNEG